MNPGDVGWLIVAALLVFWLIGLRSERNQRRLRKRSAPIDPVSVMPKGGIKNGTRLP